MRHVEAARDIAAPARTIWAILTDPERLTGARTGIVELEGEIREGGRLRLRSEVAPKQVFRLRVRDVRPEAGMVWQGGMPLGLFTGRRSFTLSPQPTGTRLHVREAFTGPLAGPICKTMPDLQPSFERFVDGVKAMAEGETR